MAVFLSAAPAAIPSVAHAGAPQQTAVTRGVGHWEGLSDVFAANGKELGKLAISVQWDLVAPGVARIATSTGLPGGTPSTKVQVLVADPNDPMQFDVVADDLTGRGACADSFCTYSASAPDGRQADVVLTFDGTHLTITESATIKGELFIVERAKLDAVPSPPTSK
jgi:hypothetical protein